MSEKIKVEVEIGDNLKELLEKIIEDSDVYSTPRATGDLISGIMDSINSLATNVFKMKKEECKCHTSNKKEDLL